MLMLRIIRSHPDVAIAAAVVGATAAGYVICNKLSDSRQKQETLQKIKTLNASEQRYRDDLKNRLIGDRSRYVEIANMPFDKLVAKLQSGELKALEVLHAYQFVALETTEKTNCVTQFVRDAEQRATCLDSLPASEPKRPFHGVPISMKESFLLEGTEATCGFGSMIGISKNMGTGALVQVLINQGFVPFVKTNVPQGMISSDSRNPVYGITLNPHDVTRSPGGSSSGEGALLAANASVLGIGTDIAGSARIPAAWCGVYSLKPTSQRMISDRGGAEPGSEGTNRIMPHDFGTYSFMARDSNTLCTVYRQFCSESTFSTNPEMAPLSFRDKIFDSKKPLVVGYYTTLPGTVDAVPAMKRGVRLAKEALEKCGHKVVEFAPPNPRKSVPLTMECLVADGGVDTGLAMAKDVEIAFPNQHVVASTWPDWYRKYFVMRYGSFMGSLLVETMFAMVPKKTPHEVNLTLRKIKDFRKEVLDAMKKAGIDVLLGPGFSCPATSLDAPRDLLGSVAYTCFYNALNWPAGSMPVTKVSQEDQDAMASYQVTGLEQMVIKQNLSSNSVGLPVVVQIAGKPYSEEIVLRLMQEIDNNVNRR